MFSLLMSRGANRPRSTFSKVLTGIGYGGVVLISGSVATYGYYDWSSNMSSVFMGKTKHEEKLLEQEFKIPLGKLIPKMSFVMLGDVLGLKVPLLQAKAEEIVKEFPDIHIGYSLLALLTKGEERNKYLDLAHETVTKNPEQNAKILYLLPDKKVNFNDVHLMKPIMETLQKGEVWTYKAVANLPKDANVVNQSTIVKRKMGGKLIVINPTQFDEAAVKWIESLGPVSDLVTTTVGHGYCLAKAAAIWPQARLWGTSPESKHDHPELKWNWLNDSKQQFLEDLVHKKLEGSFFSETVFYHPSTKTLTGVTDTLIDSTENIDYHLKYYLFSVGVLPRQGVQGYLYAAVTDWFAFRRSWEGVLKWDVEHLVLGHGEQYHGQKQILERIDASYSWLLGANKFPGWFERRVYLPIKWIRNTGLAPAVLGQKFGK